MSKDFNVNEFRTQRQFEADESSHKSDFMLFGGVAFLALMAGGMFGYNKFTEHKKNQPQTALFQQVSANPDKPISIEGEINSNPILRAKMKRAEKAMEKYDVKPVADVNKLSIQDFVKAVDFQGADQQRTKFQRTMNVLTKCGSGFIEMSRYYNSKNYPKLKQLKDTPAKPSSNPTLTDTIGEAKDLKTPADVLKWKMSGGAERHMAASMDMMSSMGQMNNMYSKRRAKSQAECQSVKQLAQTGQLDIRL